MAGKSKKAEKNCDSCVHSYVCGPDEGPYAGQTIVQCRKNAPSPGPEAKRWPRVERTDCCGEYESGE